MDRLAKTLASYGIWAVIFITCPPAFLVAFLVWLVTVPFDRRLRVLHLYSCAWASFYTYVFPYWFVKVRNRERLRNDTASVVVANHQSLLDILVLFRLFTHFKWVSKIENFRVPAIGWNMALNGYIKLRRGDKDSIADMMAACERTLAEGNSIMMFPEGTRSPDGRLREFKHGAFTLAQQTRRPLLPILIHGTADALPKRGFVIRGHHAITIRVLDEIPYEQFAQTSVEQLTNDVRAAMAAALGQRSAV